MAFDNDGPATKSTASVDVSASGRALARVAAAVFEPLMRMCCHPAHTPLWVETLAYLEQARQSTRTSRSSDLVGSPLPSLPTRKPSILFRYRNEFPCNPSMRREHTT